MTKDLLYNVLNKEQRDYLDFLLDNEFSKGYTEGVMNTKFVESYNNNRW